MGDKIEESLATTSLTKASQGLNATSQLLLRINPPVQELTGLLVRVDGYFGDADSFLTTISRLCTLLHDALQLCKWVGELIPEVGPVIADAATTIENWQIEQKIRKIADDIDNAIKKARDGVFAEVKSSASFVASKLEGLTEQLPGWSDTVTLMSGISHLIDIVVYTAFKDMKDEAINKVIDALNKSFGGVLTDMNNVAQALEPVTRFVENTWDTIKQNLLGPLKDGFEGVMQILKPVMDVVQSVCDACSTIKEWFEPFMWVLKALQCIIDKTVGWLIRKIENVFRIDDLMDNFKNCLMKALGVQAAEDAINNLVSGPLEEARKSLKTIDVHSIEDTVTVLATNLTNFRKDPASALLNVVGSSGILGDFKDWDKPVRIPIGDIDLETPNSDTPSDDEASKVKTIQSTIDDFVNNMETSDDLPSDDTKSPLRQVPKLRYALYNDEPISIRMRTINKDVLDRQQAARSEPLAPLDILPDQPTDDRPSKSDGNDKFTASSGGLAPNFDEYVTKCDALVSEITKADQSLQRAVTAAKQADDDFASYSPNALAFCDELILLLNGADPILDAVNGLLELPLHYRDTITNVVRKWLQDADWPQQILPLIDQLFLTVDDTKQAVAAFRANKATVQDNAGNVSKKYKAFHDHVARACSPDIFSKALGPTVFNLGTFIANLQRRLHSTVTSLVAIKRLGCQFFRPDTEVGKEQDKKDIAAKLNDICGNLVKVVDSAIVEIQSVPAQVDAFYQSLTVVHSDVQSFFQMSKTLSDHCRTVEAKLIASDRVRALCSRINTAVGPFETVLDQLVVHAESTEAVSDLKALSRLDPAVEFVSKILNAAIFAGISSLLQRYFQLSDIEQPLTELSTELDNEMEAHLSQFEADLAKLTTLVQPAKVTTYTVPTTAGSPPGPTFFLENPLLDDATAKSLGEVFQEILNLVGPDEAVTKTMPWANPTGKNVQVIEDVYLKSWGNKWDAIEPNYPSAVWTDWYKQLRGLDQLMNARKAWQRMDLNAPLAEPAPTNLTGSNLQLWNTLETKATTGGMAYENSIQAPLQKPLEDRIRQLFMGVVQLQGHAASTDILKMLPPPSPSQGLPSPKAAKLPKEAMNLVTSAYPNGKVGEPLSTILRDQQSYEDLAVRLQPHMAAASVVYTKAQLPASAGTDALVGIHNDYNLIEARKLLEATRDGTTALEFAKLAGSDQGLES